MHQQHALRQQHEWQLNQLAAQQEQKRQQHNEKHGEGTPGVTEALPPPNPTKIPIAASAVPVGNFAAQNGWGVPGFVDQTRKLSYFKSTGFDSDASTHAGDASTYGGGGGVGGAIYCMCAFFTPCHATYTHFTVMPLTYILLSCHLHTFYCHATCTHFNVMPLTHILLSCHLHTFYCDATYTHFTVMPLTHILLSCHLHTFYCHATYTHFSLPVMPLAHATCMLMSLLHAAYTMSLTCLFNKRRLAEKEVATQKRWYNPGKGSPRSSKKKAHWPTPRTATSLSTTLYTSMAVWKKIGVYLPEPWMYFTQKHNYF